MKRTHARVPWVERCSWVLLSALLYLGCVADEFGDDPGTADQSISETPRALGGPIPLPPCRLRPRAVTQETDASGLAVQNGRYRAHISNTHGGLDLLERGSGSNFVSLLDGERLQITTDDGTFDESDLGAARVLVPRAVNSIGNLLFPGPNYVKVTTEAPINGTDITVRRTYEFTQGEHIYVHLELHATRDVTLQDWFWWFDLPAVNKPVFSSLAETVSFMFPAFDAAARNDLHHPVNSIKTDLRGYMVMVTDGLTPTGEWARRSSQQVNLKRDQRVIGGVAISAIAPGAAQPDFNLGPGRQVPYYPDYGIVVLDYTDEHESDASCRFAFNLSPGRPSGVPERYFDFTSVNEYANLDGYVPVDLQAGLPRMPLEGRTRGALDQLLRANMHLLERMSNSDGWPVYGGWDGYRDFACGLRYTPGTRGYSSAVYLWARLTLEWDGQRYVSCTSTTDPIYEQLQYTDRYFEPRNGPTFADQLKDLDDEDYISYSTGHRETDPAYAADDKVKGVINAHSHALHFVALMRDAARLKGEIARSDEWQDRLERYHAGTKAMFAVLHPGVKEAFPGVYYPGHMGYALSQPFFINPNAYTSITIGGMMPGYVHAGEYELELIESMERLRTDWDPFTEPPQVIPYPNDPLAWAMVRANPLSLSFLRAPSTSAPAPDLFGQRDHALRATNISTTVKLHDLLDVGRLNLAGLHDRARYIRDSLGRYVLTNERFYSDWVPGAWEEVPSAQAPPEQRFTIEIPEVPFDGSAGFWTGVQEDRRLEVMTSAAVAARPRITVDAVYGSARIQVRRHVLVNGDFGLWDPVQTVATASICQRTNDRCTFELPAGVTLGRRDLLILEFELRPAAPQNLRATGVAFSNAFTVAWDPVTHPGGGGVLRYEIQRSQSADFAAPTTTTVSGTSLAYTGLAEGFHYFRVRACTLTCGNYSATLSREVDLTPTPPTNVDAGAPSPSGSYAVSWTAGTGFIDHYELQQSRNSNFSSPTSFSVIHLMTSRAFVNQAPGSYYYRVRSTNAAGRVSAWAVLVNAQGMPRPVVVP